MIRKNLKLLLITSVVILLPILVGIILWNQLPEQIPSHWNAAGEIDRWSSKAFTVFGMPLILLGFQWLCVLGTSADPKRESHPEKILHLVFWIIPVLSVILHAITYAVALGKEVRVEMVMPIMIGLIFAIVGNYLPKCKQNYTIGIKIPWTLSSEENWNKTHRFGGKVMVAGGVFILSTAIWGNFWILIGALLVMLLLPTIYSYRLYRKQIAGGDGK